jgi:hypothetical protein
MGFNSAFKVLMTGILVETRVSFIRYN